MYFAWLGTYTVCLTVPALVGAAVHVYLASQVGCALPLKLLLPARTRVHLHLYN